jgi:hypothetical protein
MLGLLKTQNLKACAIAVCLLSCVGVFAQIPTETDQKSTVPVVLPERSYLPGGVGRTSLQCAGYFRMPALKNLPQIVGGEQEQEQTIYATGDFVYLDAGQKQGISEGQSFHIIRPRGGPTRVHREKKGYLGVFVQEVGELRVIRVKENVSIAQITFACDTTLLGDFLTGVPDRVSPEQRTGVSFDRFGDPSGKAVGRVMMARDGKETVATGDIIYVDIGDEDKAVAGDYLTIYREVGTGNLNVKVYDLASQAREGFASEQYRGGELSMQARRGKELKGEDSLFRHEGFTLSQIENKRPQLPRKIVGEAMIINVQVRTATAVIMSSAQEIHTGDFVQLK